MNCCQVREEGEIASATVGSAASVLEVIAGCAAVTNTPLCHFDSVCVRSGARTSATNTLTGAVSVLET